MPENSELWEEYLAIRLKSGQQPRAVFASEFARKDIVKIDGHDDLRGHVIGHSWQHDSGPMIEVAWIHQGINYTAWFQPWRLHKLEGQDYVRDTTTRNQSQK